MDISSSLTSSSDNETKALDALLDVFSSMCSLEEIASAYCQAHGDVNKAGEILTERQHSISQSNEDGLSVETNLPQIEKLAKEKCVDNSNQTSRSQKEPKLQKASASFGTVSSMLGKGPARATATMNRASEREKPLKLELPNYMRDDFNVKSDGSDPAPKRETLNNKDVEEFLFSMLGEGFKLSIDLIREVLASCGYDIKKSMEELLSFSAKALEKRAEMEDIVIKDAAVGCYLSEGSCPESSLTYRHGSDSCAQKEKYNPRLQISPGELIESIFTVPDRSEEEPKGRQYDLGANRSRVPHQEAVTKPLEDISSSPTDLSLKSIIGGTEPILENDDDYQNYHRVAKQHWDTMKHYYEKAVDAFRDGDQKEVEYLLVEGRHYYRMARLADEKSAGEIIKSKERETTKELCLDLSTQDATNINNLLKIHLSQLANIPSIEFLRVIIGADDDGTKKGHKRRKVMRFLERKSLQWSEDEVNPGTIIIRINQLDPGT